MTVLTGADAGLPESASVAEQSRPETFEPSHAQVKAGVLLRLDDEIAGLLEAADMPAAQAGPHPTKPEAASPVAGEPFTCTDQVRWCIACLLCFSTAGLLLCCAVLCCAVLCCAVLCCAVLCCAVLCCALCCSAVMLCCAASCFLVLLH